MAAAAPNVPFVISPTKNSIPLQESVAFLSEDMNKRRQTPDCAEELGEHDLPHDTAHIAPPVLLPFDEECNQDDNALPGKPKRQLAYWQWPLRPLFDLHDWLVLLSSVFGAPLVIAIILVYGVNQGFSGSLQDLVTSYFWKDTLHMEPDVAQVYGGVSALPWDLKPIYGLITDAFPIYGFRRSPYLALLASLGMLCWWTLALLPAVTPLGAAFLLSGVALSTAFPDVVIDAVVAQSTRIDPRLAGDLQSLSWGSMAAGGLVGYSVSGPAVAACGIKASFLLLSLTFGALLLAARILPDKRMPSQLQRLGLARLGKSCHLFVRTVRQRAIWRPALFIYLVHGAICPDISTALFFWYTDPVAGPGFSSGFMGAVYAIGYVGSLAGVAVYNTWLKHHSYRYMLFWAQILMTTAGVLDLILVTRTNQWLGIPDAIFGIGDKAASDAVRRLQLLPILVLAAHLCPPGIEGTLFAFLMSVSNFGTHSGQWIGAVLLRFLGVSRGNYSRLWLAVVIRTVMRLLPILFLKLVPEGNADTVIALEVDGGEREGVGGGDGGVEEQRGGMGKGEEDKGKVEEEMSLLMDSSLPAVV